METTIKMFIINTELNSLHIKVRIEILIKKVNILS